MERLGDLTKQIEQNRRIRPFIRAVICQARGQGGGSAENIARSLWPTDRDTIDMVSKGTATITSTATTNAPVATAISDIVSILGPGSAFGGIASRAIQVALTDYNAVTVPSFTAAASGAGYGIAFVGQGSPAPIGQLAAGGVSVTPRKLILIAALTRQVVEGSNAEALTRAAISDSIGVGLDSLLLDATDTDGVRPAGLRHGINAIAATANGGNEAMIADVANVVAAVAPIAGMSVMLIASPQEYWKILLRRTQPLALPLLCSAGLADGTIMAIAVNALVIAADGSPRFDVSDQAVLHMDTSPAAVSASATPNTVAAPLRSLWQTDSIAVRLVMQADWALRASGAVAWVENVTW